MQITGQVHAIMETRSGVSQRGEWSSQEFVLAIIDGNYVSYAVFNIFGADKIAAYNLQQNETITLDFSFKGRESNGRWYNSLDVFNVYRNGEKVVVPQQTQPQAQPVAQGQTYQGQQPYTQQAQYQQPAQSVQQPTQYQNNGYQQQPNMFGGGNNNDEVKPF